MIYFHNNIPLFGMSALHYQENYLQGILYATIYMNDTLPFLAWYGFRRGGHSFAF